MRQSCCFCLPLLWEEWITFLLQTQSTQIGTPGVKSKKERKKDLKAASFQSISSFFMMYYLWQGVDGSLSGLPVCFIKAVSLLSRFNDKQHASSHILLPATLIIRDYPGNIGVCIYTRCKATTSVCVEHVLITSWKTAVCVLHPNQTLSLLYRNENGLTVCNKKSRAGRCR